MKNLSKLANVANTASYYRYCGWVTVGLGAHDEIIISPYGRRPSSLPSEAARETNVTTSFQVEQPLDSK